MSFNFALAQTENESFTTCKDRSESLRNRYAMHVPNYTQIYFPLTVLLLVKGVG